MDDCWTCTIATTYVDLAADYVGRLSDSLAQPMLVLFLAITGLWVVVRGTQLGLGHIDLGGVVQEFVTMCVAWVLLHSIGYGLIDGIYQASLGIMSGAAQVAFVGSVDPVDIPGGSTFGKFEPVVGLVKATETGVERVFAVGGAIIQKSKFIKLLPALIYALVLVLPYFLLLVMYFGQVIVAIFRVVMLAVFSPFLMLAFGFNWGRGLAAAGARTLLASTLVLFAATAAVGIVMSGASALITEVDLIALQQAAAAAEKEAKKAEELERQGASAELGELDKFGSIEDSTPSAGSDTDKSTGVRGLIHNPKFLLAVALGWMGAALLTEATGLANSIAQSALSNDAVGMMTRGAAVTQGAVLAASFWPGRALGGILGGKAMGLGKGAMGRMSAGARALLDRRSSVAKGE